jgi:diguanylate cyclase
MWGMGFTVGLVQRFSPFPRFAMLVAAMNICAIGAGVMIADTLHGLLIVCMLPPGLLIFHRILSRQHAAPVRALRAEHAHLRASRHDALTGLPNRLVLRERLDQLSSPDNTQSESFAVLALDLDGFKAINDRHGHASGDEFLLRVAGRLQYCVRADDVACRIGGDEFIVVLTCVEISSAMEIATRLVEEIAKPVSLPGGPLVQAGTSIGIAMFPDAGTTPDALLRAVDLALYRAKRSGKNRVVTASIAVDLAILDRP